MIEKELTTGILAIDLQHDIISDLIDGFAIDVRSGDGEDQLPTFLKTLRVYTVHHFKVEEEGFDQVPNPSVVLHQQDHNAYLKQLNRWIVAIERKQLVEPQQVLDYLNEWLHEHIHAYDQPLCHRLQSQGLDMVENI